MPKTSKLINRRLLIWIVTKLMRTDGCDHANETLWGSIVSMSWRSIRKYPGRKTSSSLLKKIKLYFIFNVTLSTRFDYLYDGYQQCTESQCKGYSFAVLSTVGVNYYDSELQARYFKKWNYTCFTIACKMSTRNAIKIIHCCFIYSRCQLLWSLWTIDTVEAA